MLQRIKQARTEESGFTLIELLLVIVILGILAAIVVFSVAGISDRGKKSACKSDVKSVEVAEEAYYAKTTPAAYTDIPGLVGAKLLHSPPSTTNGYTITADPATGAVTSSPSCDSL